MDSDQVWVVAQVKEFDGEGWATDWDLGGVFTTETKARAACTAPGDCMWAVHLDEAIGRTKAVPPGITYPAGGG
ncbi:hypothetical protein JHN53_25410 [Streptomyces sp. MBT58]|uniref:hypothetical protein n=1 Tax=Streptomyces sp. MBT58 TaxID=1488389 RepID=UPI001911DADF|nr:hypothetical protein [Streptomyces sp. MBT58]MBK5994921.1 hypothetical protein [Streptomyces sp. MBT58]